MTSERGPRVAWQGSLFEGLEEGGTRLSFDRLRRDALGDHSWLDVVPGWVPDHGDLFDRLLAIARGSSAPARCGRPRCWSRGWSRRGERASGCHRRCWS